MILRILQSKKNISRNYTKLCNVFANLAKCFLYYAKPSQNFANFFAKLAKSINFYAKCLQNFANFFANDAFFFFFRINFAKLCEYFAYITQSFSSISHKLCKTLRILRINFAKLCKYFA